MFVLDSSTETHFETADTDADLYYLAGWLVIGEQLGNAPSIKVTRDDNNRTSFLDIEHSRLSSAEDNRRIHKNPNDKGSKADWQLAIHDMTTILAGPISEQIFRESRGEKMKEGDDIVKLLVRSIYKIQDISRASRSLFLDIDAAVALSRRILIDPVYKKHLGDDLNYLPNFQIWMPWLLKIAAELYPPEYGCLFGCRTQVESAHATVRGNWDNIKLRAQALSSLFGYSLGNRAAN
jgi:hypothetical protein